MPSRKASAKKAAPAEAPFETPGAQAAYEKHLPTAEAFSGDVVPMRADTLLAYHNVKAGVDAVLAHEARLAAELPTLDRQALAALPELALAVGFADARLADAENGPTTIPVKLGRAHELRALLLASADALARAGLVPESVVATIREGRGSIDAARDCVDLAALFQKHAPAIKGRSPVTAAHVKESAALGSELLTLLRPKGARRKKNAGAVSAAELRDRLWTLLVKGHRDVRRAGFWLWADELATHVPPLQSRVLGPRKKKAPAVG